jgi:hypothetical protein
VPFIPYRFSRDKRQFHLSIAIRFFLSFNGHHKLTKKLSMLHLVPLYGYWLLLRLGLPCKINRKSKISKLQNAFYGVNLAAGLQIQSFQAAADLYASIH